MFIYNTVLADEIMALNAIYSDNDRPVVTATFSSEHHTTVSLKIPTLDDLSFSFLLRILNDYPKSCPEVLGVDSLVESTRRETQQLIVYLGACLRSVHYPDNVNLFDGIEEFVSLYTSLRDAAKEEELARQSEAEASSSALPSASSVPTQDDILRELAIRARAKQGAVTGSDQSDDSILEDGLKVVVFSPFEVVDCSSCLDPFFRVNAVNLQCRHALCYDCFREGVISMYQARSQLRCCGNSVPLRILRKYQSLFPPFFIDSFEIWLTEHTAINPIYCPWEDCLCYIPKRFYSYKVFDELDYIQCQTCKRRLCMGCRRKEHAGFCRQDKKLKRFLANVDWKYCPGCQQLVERNGGCNHMSCKCGAHFCYRCGKIYENGNPTCECKLFQGVAGH